MVMVMATGANELANQPEHSTVQSTHLHMPSMSISSASISLSLSLARALLLAKSHNSAIYHSCFGILFFFQFGFVLNDVAGDFFRFNTF